MKRFKAVAFAMSLALSAVANAQNPAPKSETKSDQDKKICRREVPTGSNFAKKVCHTKADWKAINAQNQSDLEQRRLQRPASSQ